MKLVDINEKLHSGGARYGSSEKKKRTEKNGHSLNTNWKWNMKNAWGEKKMVIIKSLFFLRVIWRDAIFVMMQENEFLLH